MNNHILKGALVVALFSIFSSFAVQMPNTVTIRVENQTGKNYLLQEAKVERLAGNREQMPPHGKPVISVSLLGSAH